MNPSAQLSDRAKTALRSQWNRWRHRGALLGAGTYVQAGAQLARGTIAGRDCAVLRDAELLAGTRLADRVVIGRQGRVARSTVGSDCTLEPDTELYNSTLADHIQVQRRTTLTDVSIGRFTYLGHHAFLNRVTVGSFCSIGPSVLAGLGEHPVDLGTTSPVFYSTRRQCGTTFAQTDCFMERRPITIGHDVWIGARVFVRDGVSIGHGAIIAAGAVVIHDVPPYAIFGGTPAKLVRMRFPDTEVARLLAVSWWDWPEDRLRAAQPLLAATDIAAFLEWAEASPPAAAAAARGPFASSS